MRLTLSRVNEQVRDDEGYDIAGGASGLAEADGAAGAQRAGGTGETSAAETSGEGESTLRQAAMWLAIAAGGFVLAEAVATVLVVAGQAAAGKRGQPIDAYSPRTEILGLIGIWAGFLVAVAVASRRFGTGRVAHDMGLRFRRVDILVGPLMGAVGQYILNPLVYLPFVGHVHDLSKRLSAPARHLTSGFPGADLTILAVLVVGVVPVVEELFFRGLLFASLLRLGERLGPRLGPLAAIVVGGVLFGLAHVEGLQLAGLAAFGILLCAVAYKTRRIGTTILAHATYNLLAVLAIARTTGHLAR